MVNFLNSRRKFRFASSVHNMYFCAKTKCCSCSIHRYISSAYYSNFLAGSNRCIVRIIKCFHQITSRKVFICREYFVCILTRNSHKHRKSCSGPNKDRFKSFLFHKLIDRCGFSDHNICLKFYAKFFYFLYLFRNNLLFWQTELRNSVYKHSAELMKRLKYSHIISKLCKISRTCKTRRPGTDYSNFVSVLLFCTDRFNIMIQRIIRNKSFKFSD